MNDVAATASRKGPGDGLVGGVMPKSGRGEPQVELLPPLAGGKEIGARVARLLHVKDYVLKQ